MPNEPEIKILSQRRRNILFKILFVVFLIALPFFIFYTTGYRISFEEEGTMVVTTGGVYVTTNELEVDVYLDEERVERPRLFRSAYYIQNIEAGQHRIVVQGDGLQTWVKELPVDPYIVTEVAAFNMPEMPIIRPIAQYVNGEGLSVFIEQSTSTDIFAKATTSTEYILTTRRSTTTLEENSEFDFVDDLFNPIVSSSTSLLGRFGEGFELFEIVATTTNSGTTTVIYPYVERGDMRLVDKGDEIFASWVGQPNSVPHYFCVTGKASSTIVDRYGEHVSLQVERERRLVVDPLLIDGTRFCRSEIRLDRKWQDVQYYEFLPGSRDHVVLHLQDGLYVTEIDDRAWQNTQQVYPGDNFEVVVTDNNIYIKEEGRYFELVTEVEQ